MGNYYRGKRGKCERCGKIYGWDDKRKLSDIQCECGGRLKRTVLNTTRRGCTKTSDVDVIWLEAEDNTTKKETSMSIYSLGNGMKKMDVSANDAKNNLEVGRVLKMQGYEDPTFVIVKNLGLDEKHSVYGASYMVVNIETFQQSRHEAFSLKHISEKKDQGIQTYITDEVMDAGEVLNIWEKSEDKRKNNEKNQELAKIERERKIKLGKEIAEKKIPKEAKALIIAERDIDECDSMTDYFSTRAVGMVVLGWSKHTRDIFSEMRKHAHKLTETKHLAEKPKLNGNGRERTEENKSYWTPGDEHREKHSMGHGYYLKATGRYSSGWVIRKQSGWGNEVYIALAEKQVF